MKSPLSIYKKHDVTVQKRSLLPWAVMVLVMAGTHWSCNYHHQKSKEPAANENPSIMLEGASGDRSKGYFELQQRLFKPFCLSCHHSGQPGGGVNLETYEALVKSRGSRSKLPILVSGKPQESSLLMTIVTGQMPPGPKKPPQELIDLLSIWIEGEAVLEPAAPAAKKDPPHDPRPTEPQKPSPPPQEPPDLTNPPVSSDPQPTVSFAEVQNKVINDHCLFCHEENYASGEIYLATLADLLSPQGVGKDPLVRPGDLKNSPFYQSMIRTDNRMPPGDEPLPQELTDLVKNWIETGAAP